MKKKTLANEGSALAESEKWKIMEWLWDKISNCPCVDAITDVDAPAGTITLTSMGGEEYTLKITKGNWRQV